MHPPLQCNTGDYDLVLRATLPKPDVHVVGDLLFGLLPVESKGSKQFTLVNHGHQAAPFRLECDR